MTDPAPIFNVAALTRFAAIKAEIWSLLPQALPCSEAVYKLAQLFVEVRDHRYQKLDGHETCEPWMLEVFRVGPHQAAKYFKAATLPEAEVAGKRQGIEVMFQIAQEEDEEVRTAMWELAETERMSETALRAGRMKLPPYLNKGRRKQGIGVMVRAARKQAEKEQRERERKKRTRRTEVERSQANLELELARLEKLLSEPMPREQAQGLVERVQRLAQQGQALAERNGIPWTSPTSAGTVQPGPGGGSPATEEPVPVRDTAATRPAAAEGPRAAPVTASPASPEPPARPAPPSPPGPPISEEGPAKAAPPQSFAARAHALQLPAEILPFRSLLRFIHDLPVGPQFFVQNTLVAIILGHGPRYRVTELYQEMRRFLPRRHSLKRQLSKLGGLLRAEGVDGRRVAVHCLMAARLPGYEEKLLELGQADLPKGLLELVRFYRDLQLGPCYS